jgi:hypothetical protein
MIIRIQKRQRKIHNAMANMSGGIHDIFPSERRRKNKLQPNVHGAIPATIHIIHVWEFEYVSSFSSYPFHARKIRYIPRQRRVIALIFGMMLMSIVLSKNRIKSTRQR